MTNSETRILNKISLGWMKFAKHNSSLPKGENWEFLSPMISQECLYYFSTYESMLSNGHCSFYRKEWSQFSSLLVDIFWDQRNIRFQL